MEGATDGIGQRVYRRDGRIGKGLPRQHRPQQHRAAGLKVAAIRNDGFDIGPQQAQRLAGK